MARNVNPTPQFLDGNGDPLTGGKMYYFASGTNDELTTYKDELETIPNTHPVILDSAGRLPNVFFSGTAKQVLTDALDVQKWERDPVGGEKELGDFALWDAQVVYDNNDIVEGSDGNFYLSTKNGNIGNDPTLDDGTCWEQIDFIRAWQIETENFVVVPKNRYAIIATSATVDGTLPATLAISDEFTAHNDSTSTFEVKLLNTNFGIRGAADSLLPGENLILEPGDTARLVAVTSTILEIV